MENIRYIYNLNIWEYIYLKFLPADFIYPHINIGMFIPIALLLMLYIFIVIKGINDNKIYKCYIFLTPFIFLISLISLIYFLFAIAFNHYHLDGKDRNIFYTNTYMSRYNEVKEKLSHNEKITVEMCDTYNFKYNLPTYHDSLLYFLKTNLNNIN